MRLRDAFMRDLPGFQQKFDYDTRTDGQPVYLGMARNEDSEDTAVWIIHYAEYDANGYPTSIKCKVGSWSGRVALFA